MSNIDWDKFNASSGEHYRFLESMARKFKNRNILDIGTNTCASALALSIEPTNHVYSFDIEHNYSLLKLPNVSYHLDDLMTEKGRALWKEKILSSAFIFLDIDPHEGEREYEFYTWLLENNYSGFVICDDIWFYPDMQLKFWDRIPYRYKIDVTDQGHWSGTGIIRFQPSEIWPETTYATNWTVVTGLFDLSVLPDAVDVIRERDSAHFLKYADKTLALDQNMVIFCEPKNLEMLKAKRPDYLMPRTKFITMEFSEFPLYKYKEQIIENRKKHPEIDHNRCNPSYYLLCMARYAMLKKVIAENPFQSTHFAWLNICIERMGRSNIRFLPDIFKDSRDKVSTCFIDYVPYKLILDTPRYFQYGRCSLCSGFFTGRGDYMKRFCDLVEEKFLYYLKLGYGHADEQLFAPVYFENKEIFDVYYGDYSEMITNYHHVRERAFSPIQLLIRGSYSAGDYTECLRACKRVWKDYTDGYTDLSDSEILIVLKAYKSCLKYLGLPQRLE